MNDFYRAFKSITQPEEWSVTQLVTACDLITCGVAARPEYVESGGVPFLSSLNVKQGKIVWKGYQQISREDHSELTKNNKPVKGDILYTRVGSFGEAAVVENDYDFSVFVSLTLIKPKLSVVDNYFLKHLLNSSEVKALANNTTTGLGVQNLNVSEVRRFELPFPPLPEQQKIAAILTSVDEVIEKTQAQIDKLKDLKTAMMQTLLTNGMGTKPDSADAALNNSTACRESYIPHTEFKDSPVGRIPKSWEVVTTGSIAKSIVPGRNKPKLMVGNIPWLTIADLGDVYVYKSKSNRGVTRDILFEAKGKTLPKNTVIMSVVGEFGVSSVASGEVVINQQLHGFVCRKNIDPEFLCFSLRYHKAQMEKLATQTTIAYMNKDNAESVQIALPTLQEQQKIASTLMSIDNNIVAVNKSLIIKKALKKALMQDLLTGKVRVKVD